MSLLYKVKRTGEIVALIPNMGNFIDPYTCEEYEFDEVEKLDNGDKGKV